MNERIKQLAEQSNLAITHDGDSYRVINIGEFAELIVQECAVEADKCAERGSWMAGYRIKQHFGVKE